MANREPRQSRRLLQRRLRDDIHHTFARTAQRLAWLALALVATANGADTSEFAPCRSSSTESDMYACMQEQLRVADAELNSSYKSLIARYRNDGAVANGSVESQDVYLKKAQIAWINLQDSSCQFETYDSIMGSGFGTLYTACLLKQTRERTQYLQWHIDHP